MSSSALHEVYKTTTRVIAEYRNGHGSAPPVWEYMYKTYINSSDDTYFYGRDLGPMWKLYQDTSIPIHWRFALLFTCDGALIPAKDVNNCAEWCYQVHKELEQSQYWGTEKVNHWKAIGDDFKKYKPKPRAIGVGIGCTSVCDPWEFWPKGEISEYFNLMEELPPENEKAPTQIQNPAEAGSGS